MLCLVGILEEGGRGRSSKKEKVERKKEGMLLKGIAPAMTCVVSCPRVIPTSGAEGLLVVKSRCLCKLTIFTWTVYFSLPQ